MNFEPPGEPGIPGRPRARGPLRADEAMHGAAIRLGADRPTPQRPGDGRDHDRPSDPDFRPMRGEMMNREPIAEAIHGVPTRSRSGRSHVRFRNRGWIGLPLLGIIALIW